MIFVVRPYGDHSNRLFQSTHIEAFCRENNIRFSNPSLWDMQGIYSNNKLYPVCLKLLLKLLNALAKLGILKIVELDDTSRYEEYARLFMRSPCILISGWAFKNPDLTKKHQQFFADKYAVKTSLTQNNDLLKNISRWKQDEHRVIGLHIRRGDYSEFQGGRYFYSDQQYQTIMQRMDSLLRETGQGKFKVVVFSNESVDLFPGDASVVTSRNKWFIDQAAMGQCDYLIGPPSTFTLWASYVGTAKFLQIKSADQKFTLDDFTQYHGQQ